MKLFINIIPTYFNTQNEIKDDNNNVYSRQVQYNKLLSK